MVQDPRHRPRRRLSGRIVRPGAADPEQHLEIGTVLDGGDLQAVGPGQPVVLTEAPRVPGPLHAAERLLKLGGERSRHQRPLAPHVDDVQHRLVPDRAGVDARAAGRARPDLLVVQREGAERPGAALARREVARDERQLVPLVDLERGGRELLPRRVRRAGVGAAVALDAGVGVQDLRVGKVLDPLGAEALQRVVGEVDRLQRAAGRGRPVGPATLQREVDRRGDQVQMLAAREVRQEEQDQAQRAPPADVPADDAGRTCPDGGGQQGGERLPGVRMTFRREQEPLARQAEAHVRHDEHPDDGRVAADAAGRRVVVQRNVGTERRIAGDEASPQQHDDARQHRHAQQVRGEAVRPRPGASQPARPRRWRQSLRGVGDVHEQVEHEPVEHRRMHRRDAGAVAKHGALAQRPHDRVARPAGQIAQAVGAAARAPGHRAPDTLEAAVGEGEGEEGEHDEDQLLGDAQHGLEHSRPLRGPRRCVARGCPTPHPTPPPPGYTSRTTGRRWSRYTTNVERPVEVPAEGSSTVRLPDAGGLP